MKSENLNLLEPSGPLQARKGTGLPLPLPSKRLELALEYILIPSYDRAVSRLNKKQFYFCNQGNCAMLLRARN